MSFPATSLTLQTAWDNFRREALKVKNLVQSLRDQSAAGDTQRTRYVTLRIEMNDALAQWVFILANTTGLEAYARDQEENQAIDLSAEYIAMRDAVTVLRDWIDNNIPTANPSGAVLERLPDGTKLTLTTVQTADFRTEADLVLAAIS